MNTDPKKSQRSSILARAAMLATLAYAVALLCAATPVTSLVLQGDANANGNSLTNAATLSAANGCFNHLYATNGLAGPVPATNLTGTVTNSVSAASVTSALFTGNASALTNFPSAATMGLGALATSNSVTTSNITGLGSGVAATLAGAVSGTGSLVGTSNATLASPTLTTPQATTYPTTYLVSMLAESDQTGPKTFTSVDAQTFYPFYKGTAGGDIYTTAYFRDPRLAKIGSTYYMFYTATNASVAVNYIGLAESSDLSNWTTISTPNWSSFFTGSQNMIWVGCLYFDGANYWLYFATAGSSAVTPYYVQFNPTTNTFGTPQVVSHAASRTIADIVWVWENGSTYYALLQSTGSANSNHYVEVLSNSTLNSTWSFSSSNNATGWGNSIEDGCVVTLPNGTTRAFFTDFGGGNLYSSDSTSTNFPLTWASKVTLSPCPNNSPATSLDWVDIVPYKDLQTDQCLNALQRGSSVLDYNGALAVNLSGSATEGVIQYLKPSLSSGNFLALTLGRSASTGGDASQFYVYSSTAANQQWGMSMYGIGPTLGMFGTGNGYFGNYSSDPNSSAPAGSFTVGKNLYTGGPVSINSAQTTSNGSAAGTVVWSMPLTGPSDKKVLFTLTGFNGTATVTIGTSFTSTNVEISPSLSGIVTMTSTNTFNISTSTNTTLTGTAEGD